uniref:Uncharacterized protein n=1 Tax=Romanomermis culicivorax TaxID=13658 RepID=A0A915KMS6_ROMCU
MHFTPQDVRVLLDRPPTIAIERQEAGPANPNPVADGPLQQNIKRSPPRVRLARPKWDVVTPKIRPNLNKVDPETKQQ